MGRRNATDFVKMAIEGGKQKMNKTQQYEEYKRYLKSLNLTNDEYEKRIREWCRRNKF